MTIQGHVAEGTGHTRVWRIARRSLAEFSQDRIPTVAAAITFFFLLALFPAIACVVSVYGMFADRSTISHELALISGFLPAGGVSVLKTDFDRLAAQPEKLDLGFLIAFAFAVWSASGGIKALIDGLNVAYEAKETRNFFHLTLHALGLTMIGVISAATAIELGVVVPTIIARIPFDHWLAIPIQILLWPFAFAISTVLSSAVYHFGPDRTRTRWRWMTWGGAVASAVWIVGTVLFGWYVRNFGHYDQIYGNLGAIVGFLTWIWLSLVALLLGAEINSEIDRADGED